MPFPVIIDPGPQRPFTTVWTQIDPDMPEYIDPPEEIRTYATREACLSDLKCWRDTTFLDDDGDPLDDDEDDPIDHRCTYIFEVYENTELRLAIQLDTETEAVFGPWAERPTPLDDEASPSPSRPDRQHANGAEPEPGPGAKAGVQWIRDLKPPSHASQLMKLIENRDRVPPPVAIAILETFTGNCERACPAPDKAHLINFDPIFRRAVERYLRNTDDTPERTWEKIKADYRSLYEAAGADLNRVPHQDGFKAFHDLVRLTLGTAHYPDRQEGRLTALARTIETLAARRTTAGTPANTPESIQP